MLFLRESKELRATWECIKPALEEYGLPWGRESHRLNKNNPISMAEIEPGNIYVIINVHMLVDRVNVPVEILIAIEKELEKKFSLYNKRSWNGFRGFFVQTTKKA